MSGDQKCYERLLSFEKSTWPFSGVDEEGRLICRQCGKRLTGRRTAYCSETCRVEFLVPRIWNVAVAEVTKRDRGICALCGRDPMQIRERFSDLKHRWGKSYGSPEAEQIDAERIAYIDALNREGFHLSTCAWAGGSDGDLWQVDHIIPVCEGGGGCSLSNLRTLCTPCHKRETAALARRRSKSHPLGQAEMEM